MASMTRNLPIWMRVLHWIIIINFVMEIFYGFRMIFIEVVPPGVIGPLGSAASEISFEMMVTRRLYATETWIAIAGLAIYLALTEFLPRQLRLLGVGAGPGAATDGQPKAAE